MTDSGFSFVRSSTFTPAEPSPNFFRSSDLRRKCLSPIEAPHLNRFFQERGAREERANDCFYIHLPNRVGQCRIASFERLNFSTAFTQRLVGMMGNFSNE
jgi:hypothetical protein